MLFECEWQVERRIYELSSVILGRLYDRQMTQRADAPVLAQNTLRVVVSSRNYIKLQA